MSRFGFSSGGGSFGGSYRGNIGFPGGDYNDTYSSRNFKDYGDDHAGGFSEKEKILMNLGESVLSSLKDGKKLSENPDIRNKIESLLSVEKERARSPPAPSYSQYDSFYDQPMRPPGGSGYDNSYFDQPMRPGGPGYGDRGYGDRYMGGRPPYSGGMGSFDADPGIRFHRVGNPLDKHRIYASQEELEIYFTQNPSYISYNIRNRLKNSLSYEMSQEKYPKRRNWLNRHYELVRSGGLPGPYSFGFNRPQGLQGKRFGKTEKSGKVKRVESSSFKKKKNEKKRLKRKELDQQKWLYHNDDERLMLGYLKNLLFELCGADEKEHAVLVLRALSYNPKAFKCLMTECATLLDKKYGTGVDATVVNSKRAFLTEHRQKYLTFYKEVLKNKEQPTGDITDAVYVSYEDLLVGKKYDAAQFAVPEDYIMEVDKTEAEFVVVFKYAFVRASFEKYAFKVCERFCVTKDLNKRINYFMNNGFLARFIVLSAGKKNASVSNDGMKYIVQVDKPCQEIDRTLDASILANIKKRANYMIETDPDDYLNTAPGLTEAQTLLFKACVAEFDVKASILKLQVVDYTPYIRLSREYKLYVFNEIIKFVYLQCLEMIQKNIDPITKEYVDMEKDEPMQ